MTSPTLAIRLINLVQYTLSFKLSFESVQVKAQKQAHENKIPYIVRIFKLISI